MKLTYFLGIKSRRKQRVTIAEYERELMIRQGREQFKKLLDRGLGMPVGLL